MGFVYTEETYLIIDRSNRTDVYREIQKLLKKLQKMCHDSELVTTKLQRERTHTILELPFEG